MKLRQTALAIAVLSTSAISFAGELSGSKMVSFVAFDGQKVTSKTELEINDTNIHQVVVEVGSIIRAGSERAFFGSDPIILTFKGEPEDIHISTPRIDTQFEANKFKKSPKFYIKTASGKNLSYKFDYLKGEGFMPNMRVIENLTEYNAGNGVAAVSNFSSKQLPVVLQNVKTKKGKITVSGQNVAEQQLQYWFQQADKATQQRFLKWAKKY
ncbi:curli polymerization inhibitor CsgI-related protein [Phocoenobacter skyensis]|uniref:UPF0319 protein QJT92_07290 n=1 Tax=Phocoenobacter skyensis TaxID=97481 RepID=A0A1H7XZR8_9PAST|nr:DUF2057 domain-containing protein [Pasteurella skyensis]MDP8079812.1 DUF2057 domain-containing protein [Pasteurella skyensis]MDP8085719.1 DUF2057 domain-containing protein [Pasteurella skyensis]MDP8161882.1 DUF2057 domain-containing protein [Pasteurella skyensis]MDP8171188.1 DUF2057 domain-containing protein [Pasteurella skyensis]MDP8172038.1 DUF2057 domain-containing protein [Pasteurella skyensis]